MPPQLFVPSFKGDEERKSDKGNEKHVRNQSVKLFVAVLVMYYYNTQFVFPQCEKLSLTPATFLDLDFLHPHISPHIHTARHDGTV